MERVAMERVAMERVAMERVVVSFLSFAGECEKARMRAGQVWALPDEGE